MSFDSTQNQILCFISPCLNEEKNILRLYERLQHVGEQIEVNLGLQIKMVFVDDGSQDQTWALINGIAGQDKRVTGLKLSRNFGKENALLAGYELAPQADFYATLDADLQDDPDVLERMAAKALEGYDIVYAERATRLDSPLYVFCTRIFYQLMQLGSKVDFPPNVSDFHLITERVRQAFLQMQESVRYSRGLIFYTGFKKIGVSYHRPNRTAGTSNFNFLKLVVLFFDALTSFSSLPLHFIALVGLVLSIISFIIGSIYIVLSFFYNQYVPGWGSIMAITLFLGSTQILMIGVIGEYLARMTQELKARPKYFVEEKTS